MSRAPARDYRPSPALGVGEGITTTAATGIIADHLGEAAQQRETGKDRRGFLFHLGKRVVLTGGSGPAGRTRQGLGHHTVRRFVCRGPAAVRNQGGIGIWVCIYSLPSVFNYLAGSPRFGARLAQSARNTLQDKDSRVIRILR